MLYCAYGSNIWSEEFLTRCPSAQFVAKGTIKDHDMTFNCGYADIFESEGCEVPCVVYSIKLEDLPALDHYEGYPKLYHRKEVSVATDDKVIEATAYEMQEDYKTPESPDSFYVMRCMEGYKEYGLDENFFYKRISRGLS